MDRDHVSAARAAELLAGISTGAGADGAFQSAAARGGDVSELPSHASARRILDLWAMPESVRHVPERRQLSAVRDAVRDYGVSGMRTVESDGGMGGVGPLSRPSPFHETAEKVLIAARGT